MYKLYLCELYLHIPQKHSSTWLWVSGFCAASKPSSGLYIFLAKSDTLPVYVLLLLLLKIVALYEHDCCVLRRRCGVETAKAPIQQGPCVPLCAGPRLPILSVIRLLKRIQTQPMFLSSSAQNTHSNSEFLFCLSGDDRRCNKNCQKSYCVCAFLFCSFKSQVVPWPCFWPITIEQRNMFCSFFCSKTQPSSIYIWFLLLLQKNSRKAHGCCVCFDKNRKMLWQRGGLCVQLTKSGSQ